MTIFLQIYKQGIYSINNSQHSKFNKSLNITRIHKILRCSHSKTNKFHKWIFLNNHNKYLSIKKTQIHQKWSHIIQGRIILNPKLKYYNNQIPITLSIHTQFHNLNNHLINNNIVNNIYHHSKCFNNNSYNYKFNNSNINNNKLYIKNNKNYRCNN